MSGWKIGDLALCVGVGVWVDVESREPRTYGPQRGQCLQVDCIVTSPKLALGFPEFPQDAFAARHFIKVTPSPELIAEERKAGVPA